jgi:hypothetical protein
MRLSVPLALALGAVVALSACGSSQPSREDDENAIRQTVTEWYVASARADGARLCALIAPTADRAARPGPRCATTAARQARENIIDEGVASSVAHPVVRKIDLLADEANAFVRLGRGEQVVQLSRVDGRWLISGFPS